MIVHIHLCMFEPITGTHRLYDLLPTYYKKVISHRSPRSNLYVREYKGMECFTPGGKWAALVEFTALLNHGQQPQEYSLLRKI